MVTDSVFCAFVEVLRRGGSAADGGTGIESKAAMAELAGRAGRVGSVLVGPAVRRVDRAGEW